MEKEVKYYVKDFIDYQEGLQLGIDEMEKKGYKVVSSEPIEKIRVVHIGSKITYQKE